jgi:hypothetical protein
MCSEVLAIQDIPTDLKQVLDKVTKNVNSVEVRLLTAQLFDQFYAEMGSDYTQLLQHKGIY